MNLGIRSAVASFTRFWCSWSRASSQSSFLGAIDGADFRRAEGEATTGSEDHEPGADCRREQADIELDAQDFAVGRGKRESGVAARGIGDARDDAGVDVAVLLNLRPLA